MVADDRVALSVEEDAVIARAPDVLRGRIEARGAGILRADTLDAARIVLIADMGRDETARLPPERITDLLGRRLPLVLRLQHGHLEAVIMQWLKGGREA